MRKPAEKHWAKLSKTRSTVISRILLEVCHHSLGHQGEQHELNEVH
jgi:hypothetical protein